MAVSLNTIEVTCYRLTLPLLSTLTMYDGYVWPEECKPIVAATPTDSRLAMTTRNEAL
jgi:hypothetical protein